MCSELLICGVSTLPYMKGSSDNKLCIGYDSEYDYYGFDESSDELKILDDKIFLFNNLKNLKSMVIYGCRNLSSISLKVARAASRGAARANPSRRRPRPPSTCFPRRRRRKPASEARRLASFSPRGGLWLARSDAPGRHAGRRSPDAGAAAPGVLGGAVQPRLRGQRGCPAVASGGGGSGAPVQIRLLQGWCLSGASCSPGRRPRPMGAVQPAGCAGGLWWAASHGRAGGVGAADAGAVAAPRNPSWLHVE
uniref:Uncharacterized protein n=1 Tax=Triticum urartu TaxID=4572 RepID=A0A8R7TMJ2_TRIUA